MSPICVIHLGHSHLAAMTPFLFYRPLDEHAAENDIEHYVFNTANFNIFGVGDARFAYGVHDNGRLILNPAVENLIRHRIVAGREIVFAVTVGGNTHNALTLLQPDENIDFVIPEEPDLPVAADATQIPYLALRSIMEYQCRVFLDDLRGIANSASGRVLLIQSPPPIKDDSFVSSMVERDPILNQAGHSRVTPALIRYKAWKVHSAVYGDVAKSIGAEILTPPVEGMDEGRWLAADCIGPDPTHGNLTYGGLVIKKIERHLNGRFAGWDWLG